MSARAAWTCFGYGGGTARATPSYALSGAFQTDRRSRSLTGRPGRPPVRPLRDLTRPFTPSSGERLRGTLSSHLLRDDQLFEADIHVFDTAHAAQVPPLLLLPLAENAIKHGPAAGHRGRVRLVASLSGGRLDVVIDNPGPWPARRPAGEGIPSVRRRIELLYDADGALDIGPCPDGGVRATVALSAP